MLLELHIENLAIIDSLSLSPSPGLNVLTGETGAGKSIIIDSVSLLLGGKGGSEVIRTGEEEATIEALFHIGDNPGIKAILEEGGYEVDDTLIIKRKISRSGRGRAFINGSLAPLSLLASLREHLISVCGQHEHQTLLKRDRHLDILDAFLSLISLRRGYSEVYEDLRKVEGKLNQLISRKEEMAKRADLLKFQVAEIESAKLKEGEEEELKERRRVLAHAESLFNLTSEALALLYNERGSALEDLAKVRERINRIGEIDPSMGPIKDRMETAEAELSELALMLRDYLGKIQFDPQELERVEARLDEILRVKRKYGKSVSEVLDYLRGIKAELDEISVDEERLREMSIRAEELRLQARRSAFDLSKRRLRGGERLSTALAEELKYLGMDKAVVKLGNGVANVMSHINRFEDFPWGEFELGPRGLDDVEFLFSPNPGEEPKPLLKTASGGELSRFILALKKVMVELETPPTLIFDEVDVGIGGRVSEVVGRRLKEASKGAQVLCVSHLPQIARLADCHFLVEKLEVKGRTVVRVKKLSDEERVKELARMLGGLTITEATRRHARELLGKSS